MEKIIAIDGTIGAGKSTLARRLAGELNLAYADTGAMFRALGLAFHRRGIDFVESEKVQKFLSEIKFSYRKGVLEIDGEDLSGAIRDHKVSAWASLVAKLPSVRQYLLQFQRSLPGDDIWVMDGRDIGTVVFPRAFCKFFLTANSEVAAERRYRQLKAKGEINLPDKEQIIKDIEERNLQDQQRQLAPLKPADDAVVIDTSEMEESEVLAKLLSLVRQKIKEIAL